MDRIYGDPGSLSAQEAVRALIVSQEATRKATWILRQMTASSEGDAKYLLQATTVLEGLGNHLRVLIGQPRDPAKDA